MGNTQGKMASGGQKTRPHVLVCISWLCLSTCHTLNKYYCFSHLPFRVDNLSYPTQMLSIQRSMQWPFVPHATGTLHLIMNMMRYGILMYAITIARLELTLYLAPAERSQLVPEYTSNCMFRCLILNIYLLTYDYISLPVWRSQPRLTIAQGDWLTWVLHWILGERVLNTALSVRRRSLRTTL